MRTRYFITLSAAFLLAACEGTQNSKDISPNESPSVVTSPPQSVAPQSTPPETEPPVRETVRAAPEPAPMPETLIGLAPIAVDGLLGAPDLVRLDGPAEVRLYSNGEAACTFHVFLYVSKSNPRTKAVEYYEARNRAGRLDGAGLADCYRALLKPVEAS